MRKMKIILLTLSFLLAIVCLYKPDYDQAKQQYIYTLTPPSCLSVTSQDILPVLDSPMISRFYRFDPAYTLLGLSYNFEHYKNNETLFIFDESQDYKTLLMGRRYQQDNEIVLPLNTALKLNKNVSRLLNTVICIYYQHGHKVRGKRVTITGIAAKVSYDGFYTKENAHLKWQKELFKKPPQPRYGMIYVAGSAQKAKESLQKKYPDLIFHSLRQEKRKPAKVNRILLVIFLMIILWLTASSHLRYSIRFHTISFLISILLALFIERIIIYITVHQAINQSFYFSVSPHKLLILYFGSLLGMLMICLVKSSIIGKQEK